MTVATTITRNTYNGDGSTTTFAFNFEILSKYQLGVYLRSSAGVEVKKVVDTHYTIDPSYILNPAGGNIVFSSPPAATEKVVLLRESAQTQDMNLSVGVGIPAESVEDSLDKLTLIVQELKEKCDRATLLKLSTALSGIAFPEPGASKYIRWNAGGTALEAVDFVAVPGAITVSTFISTLLTAIDAAAARETLLVPRKNFIINGGFNIWQRGTSFASVANGNTVADRWKYYKVGTMVHTVERYALPSIIGSDESIMPYALRAVITTPDAVIGAGDYCNLVYKVEGYDYQHLRMRPKNLSFWVRAKKTGTYCVGVTNAGADRSYVAEYTIAAADVWQKVSIAIPAEAFDGTWYNDYQVGLTIMWALACGTTFQTSPGTWQTGAYQATANQVNSCDTNGNDFLLYQVQLEYGSVSTEFERTEFGYEMARCQRYFYKSFPLATAPAQGVGSSAGVEETVSANTAIGGVIATVHLPAQMRANPTVTTFNPNAADAKWNSGGGDVAAGILNIGDRSFTLYNTAVTLDGADHIIHFTADSEFI